MDHITHVEDIVELQAIAEANGWHLHFSTPCRGYRPIVRRRRYDDLFPLLMAASTSSAENVFDELIPDEFELILNDLNVHQSGKDLSGGGMTGKTLLSVAIQRASAKSLSNWKEYYRHVVLMLFRKTCMHLHEDAGDHHYFEDANDIETICKMVDCQGQRLLHIVAEENLPWLGVKDILEVNFDAVREKDESGMMPFMLAAARSSTDHEDGSLSSSTSSLTTTYMLLRTQPDVLKMLGS